MEAVLLEDNESKRMTVIYAGNELKLMVWPLQSPDLSPIELWWDELDRQTQNTTKHPTAMRIFARYVYGNKFVETLEKLTQKMPNVCAAVFKARGDHTDGNKPPKSNYYCQILIVEFVVVLLLQQFSLSEKNNLILFNA